MPHQRGWDRVWASLPPERTPPFLFIAAGHPGALGRLIAPYDRRPLTAAEQGLVESVALAVAAHPPPADLWWIRPQDGAMQPARLGADQLRQRQHRHVVFDLTTPPVTA